jgi:hypothetical protein
MDKRKHYRVEVEYHASFSGPSLRGQGVILNLSITGCRARSSFQVTKEDSYGLLIDVPRYQNPLYVARAVVRWVHHLEFGVEFIQMELVDQHRLCELVRALKASRGSSNVKGAMR